MYAICSIRMHRAVCTAAALALSLTACEDKPPAPVVTKIELPAPRVVPQAQPVVRAVPPRAAGPNTAAEAKSAADKDLAAKVKTSILSQPGLKHLAMDVRAENGAVTLYGTADDDEQRGRAEKAAAGVSGVKSVTNQLLILRGS